MKIGIVTQSFFPVRGGVSQNVFHTANELQRRGHSVTVITARFTAFDHEHDHGLTVARLGVNVNLPVNGTNVCVTVGRRLGQQLERLEHRHRFDLVHIHSPHEPFLPLAALRHFRCATVGTFHSNTATGRNFLFDHFGSLWRPLLRHLGGRIAVSEQARRFINQYFPAAYRVIPNGVDQSRFNPAVKPLTKLVGKPGPVVVFIGRLTPRKGINYLLQAWPMVIAQVPTARLVIVGGGYRQRWYEAQVPPVARSSVQFTGYASEAELPRYFASADVCCFPSTGAESFGIVLLEAMASAKPIVATDIPGYNRVLTSDQEGVLVPPRDVPALAKALFPLLADQSRQRRYGQVGLKTAARYSWPNIVDQIESFYREILKRRASDYA